MNPQQPAPVAQRHTPGPWQYHIGRGSSPRLHIQTAAGYQIASTPEIGDYVPEADARKANARLIASAPDLLAALREMLREFEPADPGSADGVSDCDAIILARQAIARAEGRA